MGDLVKVIINLKVYEFKIAGIVGSPEFIYAMKSAASISPSAENFGLIYIKESVAKSILGYPNFYNELHLIFTEGVQPKPVIHKVEDLLKPYGFVKGTERKDQLSHNTVANEIKELEEIAFMFPALFLSE